MEVALVSGFIKDILPRLLSLGQEEYKRHKDLKGDIIFLERELRMIAATIDDQISLGTEDHPTVLSLSTEELRELAHQIEDCVDRFLYQVARGKQAASFFGRAGRSVKTKLSCHRLADDVQQLKKALDEAHHREERYMNKSQLLKKVPDQEAHRAAAECSSSWSGTDPQTLQADLVGIDAPRDELVEQLADGLLPKQLKVISIVGTHGSGKTVLAREVYESDVGRQFSLRVWVSAADRGPRDVLVEMLQRLRRSVLDSKVDQLTRDLGELTLDLRELTLDLRKHLAQERYFVVIDDMQTDQWSTIKAAFPENNDVSNRVIVTTTIQSVANACSSSNGYVHKMRRLSNEHSEQLFLKKACPMQFLGCTLPESKEVLKKCDGQPLALVSMGQLLLKKGWPSDPRCEEVCRHPHRHLKDETLEKMRRIFISSFLSLLSHGPRACLLYFGMFPSAYPIRRKRLMRRWLAEGFVETQPSSRENFDTLIDRNIIETVDVGRNDQVKTCKTYGMMHEFILHMSTSQDFITLFSGDNVKCKHVRRLSLHDSSATNGSSLNIDLSLVRSLMVFGKAGKAILDFQKYKLLRVLDLEQCTDLGDDHLKDICNLLLLKYLSLGETVTNLPKGIEKLKLLETLDLRRTKVKILPLEAILLPCLLHLFGKFQLSDKVKRASDVQKILSTEQSNLETLAGFVTDGCQGFPQIMSFMKNLRKVEIWFERSERTTDSTDLKNAIQKFIHDDKQECDDPRSLSLHFDDYSENILNSLESPCYLRSLKLKGELAELPPFIISMRGLRELCLSSTKLTSGLLAALSKLTDLQHLKLIAHEFEDFIIKDQAFPGLFNLSLVLQSTTILPTIQEEALPYLISLKLIYKDLIGLGGIKINSLRCLKEVTLDSRITQETRETWEHAVKGHPNRPKVLWLNPVNESENEHVDGSVDSTPTRNEGMETPPMSEGAIQEDDTQMLVDIESEPAYISVDLTSTENEVMETSPISEGAIQEDDTQMLVDIESEPADGYTPSRTEELYV